MTITTRPTLHLTAANLDNGVYIGPSLSDYHGNLQIDDGIESIFFETPVQVDGNITALGETNITIRAGQNIISYSGEIRINGELDVSKGPDDRHAVFASGDISVRKGITTRGNLISGNGRIITTGTIRVSERLTARSVCAGRSIYVNRLEVNDTIAAGIANTPWGRNNDIVVNKLLSGKIIFGNYIKQTWLMRLRRKIRGLFREPL